MNLHYIAIDVSPAQYSPKINLIKRNFPSISIGPHTTKNIGSIK